MDFGRYLAIAITVVGFMFGLWLLLQALGVVTSSLNTATNQIVTTVSTTVPKTIYAFQPTNPSISSDNTQGYLAQLPQCYISSNPYGGGATGTTGTTNLFSCVAIQNGAISAVVWFYLPPGGKGAMLGFSNVLYPNGACYYTPWLYVGANGYLYGGDYASGFLQVSTPISPGWHMAVVEEWAASASGPYYVALYLDGTLVGQTSTSNLPQLFHGGTYFQYADIGTGYTTAWPNTPGGWFFFNGTIAYVAIYNTVLTQSQVQQLYSAGFPNTLFSQNLVGAYLLVPGWYNGGGYYFVPYYTNTQLLSQMGISNATAISITPSGSVGAIPSSQFVALELPFPTIIGNGVVYTINNATGMDANKIFTPAINYAQDFAGVFALVILIGLVVGFIWTRRR